MKKVRVSAARVRCVAVIGSALLPVAVVTAEFKRREGVKALRVHVYVFMTFEERSALSQMARAVLLTRSNRVPVCPLPEGSADGAGGAPFLIRPNGFDVETGESMDDRHPWACSGRWSNAEGLWVHVDTYAPLVAAAFSEWLDLNPTGADEIAAPSWLALAACRKLAIAKGGPSAAAARAS